MLELVYDWTLAFKSYVGISGEIPPYEVIELRKKLIKEEFRETIEAIESGNLTNIAKEISDLIWVLLGTIIAYGLTDLFGRIFFEVYRSNMSKLGADGNIILNEYGKIQKGPNYKKAEPGIEAILRSHGIPEQSCQL